MVSTASDGDGAAHGDEVGHPTEASGSSARPSPANSIAQQERRPASSSNPPSTSYTSFRSQHSKLSSSSSSLQPADQPCEPARGYQTIASVEPTPKRPLWSLGTTLPRVRRLPSTPIKTAQPTPGSRSNFVRQPPVQPVRRKTEFEPARHEPVHGHDYANTDNAAASADVDPRDLHVSPTISASSGATADLPPIQEGEPLPNSAIHEASDSPQILQMRPRVDCSFSSPTVADAISVGLVDDDRAGAEDGSDHAIGQQRLSTARKQLVEEAQNGTACLAMQESAVDTEDDPHSQTARHTKTASMPFLPSQGFEILVPEASDKGANQLRREASHRKRSRADSQRSTMEQTRHPGLSGARPAPKGRTAGGPAAGVGIRKGSMQSVGRGSVAADEEVRPTSYFDQEPSSHELAHLDRQGSTRGSHEDHIEARPLGGRSSSHCSSNGRDTRSAWLAKSMPSQINAGNKDGERSEDAPEAGRTSEDAGHDGAFSHSAGEKARHSEETAISSTDGDGRTGHEGAQSDQDEQSHHENEEDHPWLGGQGTLADGRIVFPTTWSRWRYHSREFLAELLATVLLITVGTAVDCQVTLSQSMGPSAGSYPNQNWAWGFAVASTIYLSGGRSGAHCNPAITLALAVFRGFPWIQVPIYWSAQLLGSVLGAAITYGIYLPAIDQYEGGRNIRTLSGDHGTGRLFVTVPQLVFTSASGFGTEVAATSILMAMVLAVGDETNAPPSDGLSALVLGFVVVMIGMSFGWPTSYAISPSRDLGPRLFLSMVGYGHELWTHNAYWWLYGPQAGCFAGALLGALLYDLAIFTGEESPINYTRQGWMQSTPARMGSRLRNTAERAHFLRRAPRLLKIQSAGGRKSKEEAIDGRVAALRLSKSENDALPGADAGSKDDPVPRRRSSHTSQQLDAQEQGRL
ncbi:Major intrinsic protein [Kalmanozyma brasiliensis GHG001]|uniref:Major intrinsic protein n=1 Tax=Kalmanozyma brasiliensis (strain GHG001) TaxID=1365824 RepID=UPI002867CEA8|nr:Major intrinsic protein [Kalmanozyma brasiliensis GHG001]KAF6767579.1 Major intrinsic protein [Kalmanozyma brasiliensis GHG001]